MTNARKSRARRHKLKAHDRGEDRHNRGLAWIKKQKRLEPERQRRPRPQPEQEGDA